MKTYTQSQVREAIEVFGREAVDEALMLLEMVGDPDCLYTAFMDEDKEDQAGVIEMLCFGD